MLEPHNRAKNAAQNLNDLNLIATLSEGDMVTSDTKYHLNCLTSLCRREKKTNRTHCDEKESKEGTVAFSFRHMISTKFEISTLMNPATVLVINTSLFQMFLSNFSLTSNSFARIS